MKAIIGIVAVVAVFAGLYIFAPQMFPWTYSREFKVPEDSLLYKSEAYGFSFVYPKTYEALEYSEEDIAVGSSTDVGFSAVAEIVLFQSAEGVIYTNFEDFLFERARLACAAEGPGESISCTTVVEQEPFESAAGLVGMVFYLTEVHTDLSDNSITTAIEGPFFAFDLSDTISSGQFTALIIHPPVTAVLDAVDTDLLRSIANSVSINKI